MMFSSPHFRCIAMIVVHHLNNSRSQRILWLLEELGLPYEIKCYQRDPDTMLAPPELRAIHALGKSPIITEDDNTVAESGAIIEYLIERHGQGRLIPPAGSAERLRYTYWLHYAEGSAMTPLLLNLIFSRIEQAPVPFFIRPIVKAICAKVRQAYITPQLRLNIDFIESELNKSSWFAGAEFSAADIQMSFPLEACEARDGLQQQPHMRDWLARIRARPAFQRALEKGGPYELMR